MSAHAVISYKIIISLRAIVCFLRLAGQGVERPKHKPRRIPVFIAALLALALMTGVSAKGASIVWNNTGSDFGAASDWSGGVLPATTDYATFDSLPIFQPNLGTSATVVALNFTINGTGYNFSGPATLKLSGNTSAPGGAAIYSAIATGTNTVGVNLSLSGAAPNIIQSGSGSLIVGGAINLTNAAPTGITLTSTGNLFVNSSNSYTVPTSISGSGKVWVSSIGNASAAGNLGAGTIKLNAGTMAYNGAGETTTKTFDLASGASSYNTIYAAGAGALVISSNITTSSTFSKTLIFNGTSSANNAFNGTLADAGGTAQPMIVQKAGTGKWVLGGTNSYTGATSLISGELMLDFSASTAPQNNIIASGGSFLFGVTSVSPAASSTLTLQGKPATSNTQTLQMGYGCGANYVNLNAGSGGSITLVTGTVPIRGYGCTMDIAPSVNASVQTSATATTSTNLLDAQMITINKTDFATVSGGLIVPATSVYQTSMPAPSTSKVIDVTSNLSTVAAPSNGYTSTAGIRFNDSTADRTVTITNGKELNTYNSGGAGAVLVTPNVGAHTSTINNDGTPGATISGYNGRDFTVLQYNIQGDLIIDAIITSQNAGFGSGGLTKSGAGRVILNKPGAYGGLVTLNEGTTVVAADGIPATTFVGVTSASGATTLALDADTIGKVALGEGVLGPAGAFGNSTFITGINTDTNTITLSAATKAAITNTQTIYFPGMGGLGATTTLPVVGGTMASNTTAQVGSAATLQIGNGGNTGSLAAGQVVNNQGTVSFNRNDAGLNFANLITGTGSVVVNQGGAVALTAANTFTGGAFLNSGTLTVLSGSAGSFTATPLGLLAPPSTTGTTASYSATFAASSTSMVVSCGTSTAVAVGMAVTGDGIATSTTVTKVSGSTTITVNINPATTGASSANPYTFTGGYFIGTNTINIPNAAANGVTVGMTVTGTGINATVTSVSGSAVTLSGTTTAANYNSNLTFGSLSQFNVTSTANLANGLIVNGSGVSNLPLAGFKGTTIYLAGYSTLTNTQPITLSYGAWNSLPSTLAFNGGVLKQAAGDTTDYSAQFSQAAGQKYNIDPNGNTVTIATGLNSSGGSFTLAGSNGGGVILAGNSTYSGTTTVNNASGNLLVTGSLTSTSAVAVNNGATLTIGQNNAINTGAALSLNNGTLDLNGKTQTLGALTTLSGSSNIILTGSTSKLRLADSSLYAAAWTGTLTIQNWRTDVLGASGIDQIFFAGLSDGQLANIYLLNPTIGGVQVNGMYSVKQQAGTGELILDAGLPSITANPVSQSGTAGTTVLFTVAATGSPAPTVQWQVSTTGPGGVFSDIDSSANPSAATGTLTLANITLAQNGYAYRAVFTNAVGNATTSAATLTVLAPPAVTTDPASQAVTTGSTAMFTAAATGNPTPAVQWQVSATGTTGVFSNITGATTGTLTLTNVSFAQNGYAYRAVFTNTLGSATTKQATLTILVPPAVTLDPSIQTVVSGSTATFSAAANGSPAPAVQWQVSTTGTAGPFSNIDGVANPSATTGTLTLTGVTFAQNGYAYQAVFTNAAGSATTKRVTLTVFVPPAVTTNPVSQTVVSGSTATFTAAATGNPTPTVQWQVSATGTGGSFSNITGNASATTGTLSLPAVPLGQSGYAYRAVFTNAVGSATTTAATLICTGAYIVSANANNVAATAQTAAPAVAPTVYLTPTNVVGHPCTLWTQQDIDNYKAMLSTNPVLQSAYNTQRSKANNRLTLTSSTCTYDVNGAAYSLPGVSFTAQGVPIAQTGTDGIPVCLGDYGAISSANAGVIVQMGMMYVLTGSEQYGEFARQMLVSYANYYSQYGHPLFKGAPWTKTAYRSAFDGRLTGQFLNDAFILCNFAFAYDLIRNLPTLTTDDQDNIRVNLFEAIAAQFTDPIIGTPDYLSQGHNRSAISAAGVLMAGYACDDTMLITEALYGTGGSAANPTGGITKVHMGSNILADGLWIESSMSYQTSIAACGVFDAAVMMEHHGIDAFGQYPIKRLLDSPINMAYPVGNLLEPTPGNGAPLALLANAGWLSNEVSMPYWYGYQYYQDPNYLPIIRNQYQELSMTVHAGAPSQFLTAPASPWTITQSAMTAAVTSGSSIFTWLMNNDYFYESFGTEGDPAPLSASMISALQTAYPAQASTVVNMLQTAFNKEPAPLVVSANFFANGYGVLRMATPTGPNQLLVEYGDNNKSHAQPAALSLDLYALGGVLLSLPGDIFPYDDPLDPAWYWTTLANNTVTVDGSTQAYGGNYFQMPAPNQHPYTSQIVFGPGSTMGLQKVSSTGTNSVYGKFGVTQDRAVFMSPNYMADLFGNFSATTHTYDLAWHPVGTMTTSLNLSARSSDDFTNPGYSAMTNLQHDFPTGAWTAQITTPSGKVATLYAAANPSAEVIIGNGHLITYDSNGADIFPPVILQRNSNIANTVFGNVIDTSGSSGGYVTGVTQEGGLDAGYALLKVQTVTGGTDFCYTSYNSGTFTTQQSALTTDAQQAFVMTNGTNVRGMYLGGGTTLTTAGGSIRRVDSVTPGCPGLAFVEPTATGYVIGNMSPTNATVTVTLPGVGSGTATISANSAIPSLAVSSAAVLNVISGTTACVFAVTLSQTSSQTVTVNYATADGNALSGSNYIAQSGTLTFAPGVTVQTITVPVMGNPDPMASSLNLTANLSGAVNAMVLGNQGTGTILPTIITGSLSATAAPGSVFAYWITGSNNPMNCTASGLPAGLSIDPSTGFIFGIPMQSGTFPVTITATNNVGTETAILVLTVPQPSTSITSALTATGTAGTAFNYPMTATNSPTGYQATGLPAGLSINPATGVISGTPTAIGTFTPTLFATNAGGSGVATLVLTILPQKPVISSALTVTGSNNCPLNYVITASNNPTSFGATNLPSGLSIDTTTGAISGIPIVIGTFTSTIAASNAGGTDSKTLTITIARGPIVYVGFDYPVTNNIQNSVPTANETGLSGLWYNGANKVISPGLTYSGLNCIGNAIQFSSSISSDRSIDMTAMPSGYTLVDTDSVTRLGKAGTTLWFRFLIRPDVVDATQTQTATLNLIGAASGGGTKLSIGVTGSTGKWAISKGTTYGYSNISIVTGDTVLLVARVQFVAGSNNDQVDLFVNPPLGATAPATPDATLRSLDIGTFDRIETKGNRQTTLDELAIGTDWASVLMATGTAPAISSALAATGTYGSAFSYHITASNTTTAFSASGLPAGLDIDPTTGVISGTPSATGTYSSKIMATNAGGTDTETLVLTIRPVAPVITSALTLTASNGSAFTPFTYSVAATNNPVSFSAAGLPPGLGINASTGMIFGTPSVTGTYTCAITASNGAGSDSQTLNIRILPPPPSITSTLAVTGANGSSFNYSILGSNTPTGYTATGLPSGLSFNTSTGLISGTPTVTGTFSVTIGASNDGGGDTKILTISVLGNYAGWMGQKFTAAELLDSKISGNGSAVSGDRISNAIKYALGLNPKTHYSNSVTLPYTQRQKVNGVDTLSMTFMRDTKATAASYTVEVTNDLKGTWTSIDPLNATNQVSVLPDAPSSGIQTITVKDIQPLSSSSARFMRLKVTLSDEGYSETTPVSGYVTVSCKANSDTIVSTPLAHAPDFVGTVSGAATISASSATINISGTTTPAWTDNQFAALYSGTPSYPTYYIRFTSGNLSGKYYTIISNSATSITFDDGGDNVAVVAAGDSFALVKYWTLNDLFPPATQSTFIQSGGNLPPVRKSMLLLPDLVGSGINLAPNQTFFVTSSGWKKDASGYPNASNQVLFPDTYFIIRHPAGADTQFTTNGFVNADRSAIPLSTLTSGLQDNFIALQRPQGILLSQSGLNSGFVPSLSKLPPNRRDVLLVFDNTLAAKNKAPNRKFFMVGSSWFEDDSGYPSADNFIITPGSGFIIRKYQTITGTTLFLTNDPDY